MLESVNENGGAALKADTATRLDSVQGKTTTNSLFVNVFASSWRPSKVCSVCYSMKSLSDFVHDRSARDGHHHRCKACERIRSKQRQLDGSLPAAVSRWQARNPLATRAHRLLQAAIKRGEIVRAPCSVCGLPATGSHAHHDDYNSALTVRWLCLHCHHEHHRQMRLYGDEQMLFSFIVEGRAAV